MHQPHNTVGFCIGILYEEPLTQGEAVNLYIADRISRLGDDKLFFRTAYMWRFGRDADISRDVLEYRIGGIVPPYIREYVSHLQQTEASHAVQTVSGAN